MEHALEGTNKVQMPGQLAPDVLLRTTAVLQRILRVPDPIDNHLKASWAVGKVDHARACFLVGLFLFLGMSNKDDGITIREIRMPSKIPVPRSPTTSRSPFQVKFRPVFVVHLQAPSNVSPSGWLAYMSPHSHVSFVPGASKAKVPGQHDNLVMDFGSNTFLFRRGGLPRGPSIRTSTNTSLITAQNKRHYQPCVAIQLGDSLVAHASYGDCEYP
ncbi:hypothetical protein G7046_g7375 [Stylonectria norvegica]|nr:hypothetical protein G7046_g7375 [Stylonectria norvegica]